MTEDCEVAIGTMSPFFTSHLRLLHDPFSDKWQQHCSSPCLPMCMRTFGGKTVTSSDSIDFLHQSEQFSRQLSSTIDMSGLPIEEFIHQHSVGASLDSLLPVANDHYTHFQRASLPILLEHFPEQQNCAQQYMQNNDTQEHIYDVKHKLHPKHRQPILGVQKFHPQFERSLPPTSKEQQQQLPPHQKQPLFTEAELVHSEDHRVIKVERSEDGREAFVWVTLLAAGFLIGSSGAVARQIGTVTGTILQSWTEAAQGLQGMIEGEEVRRFRIQGRKDRVERVIRLMYSAVLKYRELCERKRDGEFVLREHQIDGVDFQYQPPPRKTLQFLRNLFARGADSAQRHSGALGEMGSDESSSLCSFTGGSPSLVDTSAHRPNGTGSFSSPCCSCSCSGTGQVIPQHGGHLSLPVVYDARQNDSISLRCMVSSPPDVDMRKSSFYTGQTEIAAPVAPMQVMLSKLSMLQLEKSLNHMNLPQVDAELGKADYLKNSFNSIPHQKVKNPFDDGRQQLSSNIRFLNTDSAAYSLVHEKQSPVDNPFMGLSHLYPSQQMERPAPNISLGMEWKCHDAAPVAYPPPAGLLEHDDAHSFRKFGIPPTMSASGNASALCYSRIVGAGRRTKATQDEAIRSAGFVPSSAAADIVPNHVDTQSIMFASASNCNGNSSGSLHHHHLPDSSIMHVTVQSNRNNTQSTAVIHTQQSEQSDTLLSGGKFSPMYKEDQFLVPNVAAADEFKASAMWDLYARSSGNLSDAHNFTSKAEQALAFNPESRSSSEGRNYLTPSCLNPRVENFSPSKFAHRHDTSSLCASSNADRKMLEHASMPCHRPLQQFSVAAAASSSSSSGCSRPLCCTLAAENPQILPDTI
eukprot:TRINITY_DN2650_c0_g1_i1.p1 TRINITY_DN2650_c0_g1~~TRINITY_DN2650_c0_g1_i1.p1  ORF type:complete len:861 (+),score=134.74 TRINITY_DN2650_c0_g1_i1:278-2860(+)